MYLCLFLFCLVLQVFLSPAGASDNGIIGGKKARAHSRPYMASLQDNGHFCGGFLVQENFVMTAAHCFKEENITVVLGTNNIKKKEKSMQRIPIEKCTRHPENFKNKYDFDIMLCKLKNNATINKYVRIIKLPNKDENLPDNEKCLVSGWGMTKAYGSAAHSLMEVSLQILSSTECFCKWKQSFNPATMLCTYFDGKNGICQGDSGGALVCKEKAYGIASFTGKPCTERYPNMYTKISAFIPWIKETMNTK